MIFIDSNIPMYLVGADHENKRGARRLLEASIRFGKRLVTDAEVFQEILHRYTAINRRDAIQPAFDVLQQMIDQCFPIEILDVQAAQVILTEAAGLSARDAIHVAVIQRYDIASIMSFDSDFDRVPGLERIA